MLANCGIVISVFPCLTMDLNNELIQYGAKILPYISIYKSPLISALEYNTYFRCGSPTREEVEQNPYWTSIAINGEGHERVIDKEGHPRRPFNKQTYKRGWFQQCLFRPGCESKIINGVNRLLDKGFHGIFIDNVITHTTCLGRSCPGRGKKQHEKQIDILSGVYHAVKTQNPENIMVINVGKGHLDNPQIKADIYMTEHFCYSDRTEKKGSGSFPKNNDTTGTGSKIALDRFSFAGTTDYDETALINEVNKVKGKLAQQKIQLLGYTKIAGDQPPDLIDRCLRKSRDIARKCDILYTERVTGNEAGKWLHQLESMIRKKQ